MTITFSRATQADKAIWDNFVLAHPDSTAYHLFAWSQSVEQAYGFAAHFWMVKEDETLIGVMPCVLMRSLKAKKVVCSLPYCDVGGMLVSQSADKIAELKAAFLEHVLNTYQNTGIHCVELRSSEDQLISIDDAQDKDKVRMILSLAKDSETLLASFKSKLRSQIRKAEKNGLTYRIIRANEAQAKDIDDFYAIIAENMRLLGSPVHAKKWYESILSNYGTDAYLALVEFEGIATAAALVLNNREQAVIPWASTRVKYNHLAPNMLLYWAVLKEANDRGMTRFDFGRSTVGEGTYKFKKQWGALPQPLNWQEYVNGKASSAAHITKSSAREHIENVWRALPLGVTNMLGPRLRKYISL